VLDRSGKSLPIDVSPFRIERFDLTHDNWSGEFSRVNTWATVPPGSPAPCALPAGRYGISPANLHGLKDATEMSRA
jgi:hypothetical protein